MKKFFYSFFFIFLLFLIGATIYLTIFGYETSKFNQLIQEEIKKKEFNSKVSVENVKIKLDLKKFNLFISTNNPEVIYYDVKIPITEIKGYYKLFSLLEGKPKLQRIILDVNKLRLKTFKKLQSELNLLILKDIYLTIWVKER